MFIWENNCIRMPNQGVELGRTFLSWVNPLLVHYKYTWLVYRRHDVLNNKQDNAISRFQIICTAKCMWLDLCPA
jgi:hypothetical protein